MAVEEIGVANECRHKARPGGLVDLRRLAHLLQPPIVHDRDMIGDAHGLVLVMGDIHEGDTDLVMDQRELQAHPLAQLEIQRRQRLVQQQHLRLEHQRPGNRGALALPAGKLARLLVGMRLHLNQRQHLLDLRIDLRLGAMADLQPEGDVLPHRHVGEKRIILKYGIDFANIRRLVGDVHSVQQNPPAVRTFKAGQHPQQRGLATAARTQNREDFTSIDCQGDVIDRFERAV